MNEDVVNMSLRKVLKKVGLSPRPRLRGSAWGRAGGVSVASVKGE
jgi:hypothetical protein